MMRSAITATVVALLGSALAVPAFSADAVSPMPGKPDSALPRKSGSAGKSAASVAGRPYYYENGQKKALRVDPGWVADFAAPAKPEPGKPRTPLKRFIGGEKALETLPSGASPVFRDDNGALRALAGGVVVRLREAEVPDARARLADAGLLPIRQLDPEGRSWLVASPSGMPSLELANQLHESGRFESATPNWWRPRSLK